MQRRKWSSKDTLIVLEGLKETVPLHGEMCAKLQISQSVAQAPAYISVICLIWL